VLSILPGSCAAFQAASLHTHSSGITAANFLLFFTQAMPTYLLPSHYFMHSGLKKPVQAALVLFEGLCTGLGELWSQVLPEWVQVSPVTWASPSV